MTRLEIAVQLIAANVHGQLGLSQPKLNEFFTFAETILREEDRRVEAERQRVHDMAVRAEAERLADAKLKTDVAEPAPDFWRGLRQGFRK